MLPGKDLIVDCPRCEASKRMMSLLSGNTVGAIGWSDGCWDMPLFLQNDPVQRCSHCGHYFRMEEARNRRFADLASCEPSVLSLEEWVEALRQFEKEADLTASEERMLRLYVLWRVNRNEVTDTNVQIRKENNERLLRLMDLNTADDVLLCAELHREEGDFGKCLKLLTGFEPLSDRQKRMAVCISEAAERQETNVCLI